MKSSEKKSVGKRARKKGDEYDFNHRMVRMPSVKIFNYANFVFLYLLILLMISNISISKWLYLSYPAALFLLFTQKQKLKEKERSEIAHSLPFFGEAVANALAIGCTLHEAFEQSLPYLKGNFKKAFEVVLFKYKLGNKLGPMLKQLDDEFPDTGFRYLICLLDEYEELGIAISPLLKKICDNLQVNKEAEQKVESILSGGSSYAKIAIFIFGGGILAFGLMLGDTIKVLFDRPLFPIFAGLLVWAIFGILLVFRITSLQFTGHKALKPIIADFLSKKSWDINSLLHYAAISRESLTLKRFFLYFPIAIGFIFCTVSSWFYDEFTYLIFAYLFGIVIARYLIKFFLKGMVEEQLFSVTESFPEFLQIFLIGLKSGLNQFKSFEFAQNAIEGHTSPLLSQALSRTKFGLLSGENSTKSWQVLMDDLPFDTVKGFCEVMIVSSLHGESLEKPLEQIVKNFQLKKLLLIEKAAVKVSQMVIPLIVLALFPVFMFLLGAPIAYEALSKLKS